MPRAFPKGQGKVGSLVVEPERAADLHTAEGVPAAAGPPLCRGEPPLLGAATPVPPRCRLAACCVSHRNQKLLAAGVRAVQAGLDSLPAAE